MAAPKIAVACTVGAAILLISGCAAPETGGVEGGVAATDPTLISRPPTATVEAGPDSTRYGDGRALTVRFAATADRLVVITTAGFAIHDGSAPPRLIERGTTDASSAALSPDGRLLAVGDGSSSWLEVWDLDAGAIVHHAAANSPVVLGFSADGSRLLFRTSDSVSSWSPDGMTNVLIERDFSGQPGTVVMSTDGKRVIAAPTGASAGSLVEWTESSGVRTIDLGLAVGTGPGRMLLSGDGSKLVFEAPSASDPAVTALDVVDLATGDRQALPITVRVLDGSMWVLGPQDRVAVWEPDELTFIDLDGDVVGRSDLTGLDPVVSMTSPTDGATVVTAHQDDSLKVWSLTGELLGDMPATVGAIREVIRPDGQGLLTVGYSGLVDRWVVDEQRSVGPIDDYAGGAVTDVAISPDGQRLALAHSNGVVEVRNVQSGDVESRLDHDGREVNAVAFSPDSSEIATGVGERLGTDAFDDSVTIWSPTTGSAIAVTGGEGESVAGCSSFQPRIRFSPNGDLLAASSHDFTVTLYDADDLEPVLRIPPQGGTILDVAFSPDGESVATASEDLKLRIWDVATGRLVREHDAPIGGYWGIAFMPDGASLVTVGATGAVALVDADDGLIIRPFEESANWSGGIALSRDGSVFAAGGKNNDILIWRVADGTVVQRLMGHSQPVNAVAISDDESFLLSGSTDGTARRWNLGD
jgi:WD40 repeat protein